MGWKRVGDCPPERCQGRCCMHIGAWYDSTPETDAFMDTLRTRGVEVKTFGDKHLVSYPQRCQYLTDAGLCALHPSMDPVGLPHRPEFCTRWPEEPSQLINDTYCGFHFEYEPEPSTTGVTSG